MAKELDLRITTDKKKLSLSNKEYPKVKVSLNNFTRDIIKIVQPGDGSHIGWRTPIIRWSVIDLSEMKSHPNNLPDFPNELARCGNMNSLKMKEIVTLRPNYGVKLQWTSRPVLPKKIGKYRVKFYYKHEPDSDWVLREYPMNEGKRIIKEETEQILLVSNELLFEITK